MTTRVNTYHTPAPWYFDWPDENAADPDIIVHGGPRNGIICRIESTDAEPFDVKLITQAPRLLEFVGQVHRWLSSDRRWDAAQELGTRFAMRTLAAELIEAASGEIQDGV